ncbi:MAG: hypothetical protein K2G26_01000 [Clostridia bacterium]|nr:hypothetical protein [Clostridia bacterium]
MKTLKEFLSVVKYKDFANLSEYIYDNYVKNLHNEQDKIIDNLICFLEWGFISDQTFDISELTPNNDYTSQFDKAAGILKPNIDNLINQNVEQREFYINIWKTVSNPSLFADDEDKIGALIFLESYDKVPYFKLDKPLDITEEEFNELFDKLNMKIQKCLYVFNRGYEYRTEVASQLLRIIEHESDERNKVVLLAGILHYLEWSLTVAKNDEESIEEQTKEQAYQQTD